MIEVGRVCLKIAGREAGLKAVIIDKEDNNFVLIDGEVKRRRCNVNHLMPLEFKLDIKGKAKTDEVKDALKKAGLLTAVIKAPKKKDDKKVKGERPVRKHVVKEKPEPKTEKKAVKKAVKKPAPKKAAKKAVKKPAPKKAVKK